MDEEAIVGMDFLIRVDSLLSCLLHRHKSAMTRINEINEVRELASQARTFYDENEALRRAQGLQPFGLSKRFPLSRE